MTTKTKQQTKNTRSKPRSDLYQEITDRIVAELEEGRFPWVRPWNADHCACAVGLPRNAVTARSYSGINILILWGAVIEHGYASQNWLTFKQAKNLGGTVRKGEHGEVICYVDRFVPKDAERKGTDEGETQSVSFLKRYRVFNADQCDGLPDDIVSDTAPLPEREIVPRAERVASATGAKIRIGGDMAFYCPAHDVVQVPPQPAFTDQVNYYRTLFHELGHYAVSRIMPHGRAERLRCLDSAMRRFGIIRAAGTKRCLVEAYSQSSFAKKSAREDGSSSSSGLSRLHQ
ncbi:ArdC family protein [Hoeflea sp.]|uniref:ArdC family protein n=1 Tax=Hoeflea sp. TaxID=1940281 RepID=UPI003B0166FC